ncbi:DUF1801 domain-containing protein [Permianibacter aggregans]|uniref:Uncharacterized protein DUF1801 n=1 Tax=Permianibacter aggregans TaxID=1510150 RepID=A0A4R6UL28_9GAMM|nr:DUF1801 domain-containing protein [Permianibacter aggregans]QGX39254.1 DUF1801 domain-containing protein [Permianibacter aggregans]TDQ46063.1 uncharacterized protein DUF1801 [Permianibacter aggregans]
MAELKTKKNDASVAAFIANVEPEQKRQDCEKVIDIMSAITKAEPVMWGSSIVGFGHYHYVYESGREGDWMLCGFSPRKQNLVLYIMSGFSEYDELMNKLGKYKTGKSCLYLDKLSDVDLKVLKELIKRSVADMKKTRKGAC